MDISTIKSKLKKNRYQNLSEVYSDFELIWKNCKTYNIAESAIVRLANSVQKLVLKLSNNLKIDFPQLAEKRMQPTNSKKRQHSDQEEEEAQEMIEEEEESQKDLTFEEKMRFAEKVRKLSHDTLSHIVSLVSQECPKAIEELDKDRIQIKVDDLDRFTFQKAEEQVLNFRLCDNFIMKEPASNKK